jgi:glycosyltransferase involved in cell wall biosynthesis
MKLKDLKDLKIVHVSPKVIRYNKLGGGERYPQNLAEAISNFGLNTSLITFSSNKMHFDTIGDLVIKKYRALEILSPLIYEYNPFPISLSFFKDLEDSDIIHLHQFRTLVTSMSVLFISLTKLFKRFDRNKEPKIVVVTDHGGGGLVHFSYLIGRYVNGFLLVSQFSAKRFLKFKKNKIYIIYGGVSPDNFYPIDNVEKENKVLFVGRILPHKGCEYLVKAVQDLNVKLCLIGPPLHQQYLKFLKSIDKNNKIIFKFNISDKDLVREYNSSVVTVLPSVYVDCYGKFHREPELLGLVLLESMACETPVICTNVGGMPEIVENGVDGFVVQPNDSLEIKRKIQYLVENPDETRKMGRNGRKKILEKYTWKKVAERCIKAYIELLEKD